VLIKPNYVVAKYPSTGITTNLRIIDGLIKFVKDLEVENIIVGEDMVAIDSVTTAVMDIDPGKIKYLRSAEERGLGISNLDDIEVLGKDIES